MVTELEFVSNYPRVLVFCVAYVYQCVHVCMCMGLEITAVVSWHLDSFSNMKISWLKSLTTFSLRTILKYFFIGGVQHMELVSSCDTRSPFHKNCHSKLILLLMNQPLLYVNSVVPWKMLTLHEKTRLQSAFQIQSTAQAPRHFLL